MSRYILSPEARDDLNEIADHIAQDSLKTARRVIKKLIYRPDAKPLQVVRVLRGARDVKSILARGF